MNNEPKSGISLSDKLQFLGVVVGLLGLAVAVYFGYLSLNRAAPPLEVPVTLTPQPSSTPAASGTVYFEDDFESGMAKWRTNPAWEIREDELGNHVLCANPQGQGYAFVNPRTSAGDWKNYLFSVKMSLEEPLKPQGGVVLDAFYRIEPEIQAFQFQITEQRLNMLRFDPDVRQWNLLTDTETELVKADTWYTILIQAEADGTLRYSVDGIQLIKYLDPAPFAPDGIIRMGASSHTNVCFDDVKVSVPE